MGGRHPQGVTMSADPSDGHAAADTSPSAPDTGRAVPAVSTSQSSSSPSGPGWSPPSARQRRRAARASTPRSSGSPSGPSCSSGPSPAHGLVVALAIAALVVAVAPALLALAAVALGIALWGNRSTRHRAELFAVSIGISLNVLARGELDGFLGLSALVAITTAAVVFVSGLRRQPRPTQRVTLVALGVVDHAARRRLSGSG